jgi:L-ascorbate metabolism protein UlaG (beta-lactamase superfamily)
MGSIVEHAVDGDVRRRVYLSGDTLTGDHVDEIRERFPDIDAAVVHLGGTRVLMRTVTMDGPMGVDFVGRVRPAVTVPVHYDDYTVFRSPLSDFVDRARAAGLDTTLRCPTRGEVVSLEPA